jgi:hypothetical protein
VAERRATRGQGSMPRRSVRRGGAARGDVAAAWRKASGDGTARPR